MGKSYGDAPKYRVWQLIEALLDYIDNEIDDDRCPRCLKVDWKSDDSCDISIETTLNDLAVLLYGQTAWENTRKKDKNNATKEISERLRDYLDKFLGIFERHGGGRGVSKWNATLKLWSRDKEENARKFEEVWETTPPPNSDGKQRAAQRQDNDTHVSIAGNLDFSVRRSPASPREAGNFKLVVGAIQLQTVPVWEGRDKVLERVRSRLSGGVKVAVIVGQGGIGKTSLAVKLLEAIGVDLAAATLSPECPYQQVICTKIDLGTSFDEVAQVVAGALQLQLADIPDAEGKIRALLGALSQRRCLLVFDNLEDVLHPPNHDRAGFAQSADWGTFLDALAYRPHSSQVVITSRELPKDLADSRCDDTEPDPELVHLEVLSGVSTDDGAKILQRRRVSDSPEDRRWVAQRVGGHTFLLTQLAAVARGKPGFLRAHPELVTRKAEPILQQQWRRQSEAARDLLRRMCVLRVAVDGRGLTFLRLYSEEDFRFETAALLEEPAELTEAEIAETA